MTIFARDAKFKVDKVYWELNVILDTAAIIIVFELPPKESLNKHVSFESLYGMWTPDFPLANTLITIPNVDRDLLIFEASFSLSPEA